MVNGPEHYARAEKLLARAGERGPENDLTPVLLVRAQVHATLALAADSRGSAELVIGDPTDDLAELRAATRDYLDVLGPASSSPAAARLRHLVGGA